MGYLVTISCFVFVLVLVYFVIKLRQPYQWPYERMTPEELQRVKEYVAQQDALKAAQKPEPKPEPEASPEPEPTPDPFEAKRQRWFEYQRQRRAEQAIKATAEALYIWALACSYPTWLTGLASKFNIPQTYENFEGLCHWVNYIFDHGQRQMNGRLSVRSLYAELGGSDKTSVPNATSRDFFKYLLRTLEQADLLFLATNRSRKIPDDYPARLQNQGVRRAACGVSRPVNRQKPGNGRGGDLENFQNPVSLARSHHPSRGHSD